MAGTELAKAYVQIVPSANGIQGSIQEVLGGEADKAGEKSGSSIASKIKTAIAAAGIGKALSTALQEGAQLEQSIGGIETLFKDSADRMKQYANDAYKTAGISANDYMEQATSFSASLLSSLGGDTKKAAKAANSAIIDMADNSNKMGTNLQDIQNAYQGFAKQNYTMLDNLKLGYGGTKTEMQRLLKDAQKLTGVKYDINNLSDVYSAIHVIQGELGISGRTAEEVAEIYKKTGRKVSEQIGTTSKEAATTFSGSFASMQAAAANFLGYLALGEDITPALNNLLETVSTFLFNNLLPMVGNIVMQIPTIISSIGPQLLTKGMDMLVSLSQGFANGLPTMLSTGLTMIQAFANYLAAQAPSLINKGFEMLSNIVQGIIDALPVMIEQLPQIITTFANIINDNFPTILMKGAELLWQFITGIIGAIPTLIANIPKIIEAIVATIQAFEWLNLGKNIIKFFGNGIQSMVSFVKSKAGKIFNTIIITLKNLPQTLFNFAKNAITKFGNSIINSTGTVKGAVKGIFNAVINGLKSLPSGLVSIGKDLVKGLWNGINDMVGWIGNKIKSFGSNVLNGIKDFFGIHSPSKVFENEVGKMLPLGMAQGIEDGMSTVKKVMDDLSAETVGRIDTNVSFNDSDIVPSASNLDIENALNGIVLQIINNTTVDGTPLKEICSEYTLGKINKKTASYIRTRGGFANG